MALTFEEVQKLPAGTKLYLPCNGKANCSNKKELTVIKVIESHDKGIYFNSPAFLIESCILGGCYNKGKNKGFCLQVDQYIFRHKYHKYHWDKISLISGEKPEQLDFCKYSMGYSIPSITPIKVKDLLSNHRYMKFEASEDYLTKPIMNKMNRTIKNSLREFPLCNVTGLPVNAFARFNPKLEIIEPIFECQYCKKERYG